MNVECQLVAVAKGHRKYIAYVKESDAIVWHRTFVSEEEKNPNLAFLAYVDSLARAQELIEECGDA